jgi:hypothetical protein
VRGLKTSMAKKKREKKTDNVLHNTTKTLTSFIIKGMSIKFAIDY